MEAHSGRGEFTMSDADHIQEKDLRETTREDMAMVATRSLALLMAVWTLVDLTYYQKKYSSFCTTWDTRA